MNAADQRIFHLLQLAAHRLRTDADRAGLAAAGLTAAQAGALFAIARQPGLSQRRLAETLRQRESAITAMLSRLLKAGYVERTVVGDDRRARSLTITPAGEQALAAMRAPLAELNARIDTVFTPDQIKVLADGLRRLAGSADANGRA